MKWRWVLGIFVALAAIAGISSHALAIAPTAEEQAAARNWARANFESKTSALPFAFTYAGRSSAELLGSWKAERSSTDLDSYRTEQTLTYTDPNTHLELRCVIVVYKDYPSVEWTLHFKNAGTSATPILENIKALDTHFERGKGREFLLHYSKGSSAYATDYAPLEATLSPLTEERFAPVGGRPTDGAFPYFNLDWPDEDLIVAVGWPGQWSAEFARDAGTRMRVRAGQELTHFKLLPGEEVRSPLVVLQFYRGDWIRAQNLWRRWMIAHNVPRSGGTLPAPQLAGGSCPYFGPYIHNNQENQELFIRRYLEEGLKLDYWWIDAGWYPNNGKWTDTGTWEVDKKRFPTGLRAVSDYGHSRGVKLIVWFEPERVTPGTWLYENHPEWLLKVAPNPDFPPSEKNWRLLNLGDPEARKWLTNHIDKLITDEGIDTYRQDFNMQALPFWRANDAEDRQGITEIRYVTGYLGYWDELRRRHPGMPIDTCASGGRRNDLETLRRSVPLWRSDYILEPVGMQNQTYGIALWIPYQGLASQTVEKGTDPKTIDAYTFRSEMYPAMHAHWDVRRTDLDYKRLRQLAGQWREIAPDYMGDYYPLTSYDPSDRAWMAWQFDQPDGSGGIVQVFRRTESPYESARFKLYGLAADARYTVTDLDTAGGSVVTGRELMEKGLPVVLQEQPEAAIIVYKRANQ